MIQDSILILKSSKNSCIICYCWIPIYQYIFDKTFQALLSTQNVKREIQAFIECTHTSLVRRSIVVSHHGEPYNMKPISSNLLIVQAEITVDSSKTRYSQINQIPTLICVLWAQCITYIVYKMSNINLQQLSSSIQ